MSLPFSRRFKRQFFLSNRLTTDFSTGLPAQQERACEIEGTVETSMSMPVSPALPGPEVVQAPYRRETLEVPNGS